MKWKLLLPFALVLVYLHLCIHVVSSQTDIILTANAFDLVISDDLIIQNGIENNQELTILSVESGLLNGSSCTLNVDTKRGDLIFYAEDSCTLEMTVVSNQTGTVTVSGASLEGINETSYTIGIIAGNNIIISWIFYMESYVDEYTVLAFGIVGVGMMVFSPAWAIRKALKEGLETDTVEGIGYAILIFIIGLGLFITFLYW